MFIKSKKAIPFLLLLIMLLSFGQSIGADSIYEDGEYDLPFTILKGENDEASMTNDYIITPGKLIIKDGKNMIQVTLKNSSWWQEFTVSSSGVTVISETNDTRIVQFEVTDPNQVLDSKIHVIVPDIDYDNKYDVRFDFDASNIPMKAEASKDENESEGASSSDDNSDENEGASSAEDNTYKDQADKENAAEKNPQTGDKAPILFLALMLLGSSVFIVQRVALR